MQRQTLVASSCLLLLAGGVAVWSLRDDAVRAPTATERTEPAERRQEAIAPPADAATTAGPAMALPTERTVVESATETPPDPAPDGRHLHGSIAVLEADGHERAHCRGTIELELVVPMGGGFHGIERRRVAVHDGAWQVQVPMAVEGLQVGEIRLDGRSASCAETFDLTAVQPPFALRASWLQALRLRVLGHDTGADLTDVRVVQKALWTEEGWRHPGAVARGDLVASGSSPLRLQPTGGLERERFWVTAPGYAWGRIEMATADPDEHVLRLRAGGDVVLTLLGSLSEGAGAVVRVRAVDPLSASASPAEPPPDSMPIAEFHAKANDPLRIDALPTGSWSLSVETGPWFGRQKVLGHTRVTVAAQSSVAASITLSSSAARQPVIVQGTLTLSPRWGREITLELSPWDQVGAWTVTRVRMPLAEMNPVGSNTYRWGPHTLLSGRWQVLVSGAGHSTTIEVGPGLPTDLHIEVPEPNDVRVRVVDAVSGDLVPGAEPSWFSKPDGWRGGHARMEPVDDGWYHSLAPVGPIQVSVHPEGYAWLHEEHEVRRGGNEFVVRVGRVCGVEIVLRHNGVRVPCPETAFAQITHTTTQAPASYWSGPKIAASEPGEHRLTFDELPGFEPIEPRTVVIEPAQWTRVEIDLRRRR